MQRITPFLGLVVVVSGPLVGQVPVQANRFFVAEPPSQSPATIREYDAQGVLLASHDLAAQLPSGVGSNLSQLRVLEVTPAGTVLASTGYHPSGGWFEVDGLGAVTTFYPDAGSATHHTGAQAATGLPGGGVLGAHYWTGGSTLRAFDASGSEVWSVAAAEALSPAIVGATVYLGHFHTMPISKWTLGGVASGTLGSYRHVFTLKALPSNRLLIGDLPSDPGPVHWIVRDLATGSETTLDTSSFAQPNRWADVDDAGRVWVLCGSQLVGFEPGATQASLFVSLPGLVDGVGLAVSGTPLLPWTSNPANGHEYAEIAASSWQEAQTIAQSMGGNLAVVDDAAENQWIVNHVLSQPSWIGGTDAASEGVWTSPTGVPLTYTNWAPGQPDNFHGGEDYAEMWPAGFGYPEGAWNDGAGQQVGSAIVERRELLFQDDFSSGLIDPQKWEVVTQGVPGANANVFVQGGECLIQNRGHLRSASEFNTQSSGPYVLSFEWRASDDREFFSAFIRSDGIPAGTHGLTANGVGLSCWFEQGGSFGPIVQGNQITTSAWAMTGPGVTAHVGTVYTTKITDLGRRVIVRVEGPDPAIEWLQFEAEILADTTAVKRITFTNREEIWGTHTTYLDNVAVNSTGIPATYVPFGNGCDDPNGLQPSLFAPAGEAPRIGTTSTLRVDNLPLTPTVPVFVIGFSNTEAQSAAGPYPLPIDLGILGWPGCPQLVSIDDISYTITTNGFVEREFVIPPLAFLSGLQFHTQALVLYTGGGVAFSNGITATAGW